MSIPSVSYKNLCQKKDSAVYHAEVKALASACCEWGFVYLVDIENYKDFATIFDVAKSFFSLPLETKMQLSTNKYKPTNKNHYRGYFPTAQASHSNKEGFEIGYKHYQLTNSNYIFDEPSVYPDPEPFKGWENALDNYFNMQLEIGNTLLVAYEHYFNLEPGYFTSKFKNTLSTLRLLHYPLLDNSFDTSNLEADGKELYSAPAHTDSGILTLLLQDNTGGLEVKSASGAWESAPPIDGSLVMNIGDLLERWTGGLFKATEHRIKAPANSRYSVPFFFEPEGAAVIKPFNDDITFDTITYESYLSEKFKSFVEYQSLAT